MPCNTDADIRINDPHVSREVSNDKGCCVVCLFSYSQTMLCIQHSILMFDDMPMNERRYELFHKGYVDIYEKTCRFLTLFVE